MNSTSAASYGSVRISNYGICVCLVLTQICLITASLHAQSSPQFSRSELSYTLTPTVASSGYDGQTCWVHARAGIIPQATAENPTDAPNVVMTMQKLLLSGSDVFYELHQTVSHDLSASWSVPQPQTSMLRRRLGKVPQDAEALHVRDSLELLRAGDEVTVCDFVPRWHAHSATLLGTGQTVWYRDNHVLKERPRGVAYATFDTTSQTWNPWRVLQLPREQKFANAGAGSGQRIDLPNGDILLPIYYKRPAETQYSVTVCRCHFDGQILVFVEHGNEMTVPVDRGLAEPSLAFFQGRFFLTLRNDQQAYVCSSEDGLNFSPPEAWRFDNGELLGNYNTQQHWVAHSSGLFLVYTRRGLDNDHVFRHRAPLVMARIDPNELRVIRSSEQIVVPERGARLGNFGVTDVTPYETWITAAEWMQPEGAEVHGSNNSVHVVKIHWNQENKLLSHKNSQTSNWEAIRPYFSPPSEIVNEMGKFGSLMKFADGRMVTDTEQWGRRRSEIVQQWQNWLGNWPEIPAQIPVEVLATSTEEGFVKQKIRFSWTPNELTEAYLLIPEGTGPHPAVVTVYYEPETSIGQGKPLRDFGLQLVRRGFVVLSLGTTEATQAQTYALYYPSLENCEVAPLSMLGYAAACGWTVLANRPDVDAKRIGIVGHSFGGKWAMFAACLFDKFACAAWSDPGIVFDSSRPSINYWEPWYLGYHPPPWRKRGMISSDNPAQGLYPQLVREGHDLHELHALMAPRPFLVSGGSEDPPHRWQALNHTRAINEILGYQDRVAMTNRPAHDPTEASNAVIYDFFEYFLNGSN
ncbi:MAG: hypothetical protein KDB03_00895 [Planctomycetales bacterium]|nr:hypothetical protein [Planctomycetales bacterium]